MLGRTRASDDALDALYRSTWHRAVGSAQRIARHRAVAEERAQAFTRAFDRWARVAAHPSPDTWVLRVRINLALSTIRRHIPELNPAPDGGHEDQTVAALEVRRVLANLPGKQRQAVGLRYLAQCEEPEIAAAMGCQPGTVKTHLARGMANLRAQFGQNQLLTLSDP